MPYRLMHLLLGFALLLLSGCSAQQAMVDTSTELNLLPPAEGPAPLLLKQKIRLLAAQGEQQFLLVARFDHQRLRLAILLPSGQRLLTLDYDGEELKQQSFAAFDLPGNEILAIMQFASWPHASLRHHYPTRDGWRVEFDPGERRLLTESGSILTIAIQPDKLRIENHQKMYRVIVQTLEKTEL
ncbi:MAG: DUF3261 domain-containing protein [Gammaproteobacteria bacterium]|nr:DUF3261 domain-containing protein [Gammaproteobacteria bacterium]